jgi:ankyrin repeat protein
MKKCIIKHGSLFFFMQDGETPSIAASLNGHTETLALLLSNKAHIDDANKVQQLKHLKRDN